MRLDCQISLTSPPLDLLAGSALACVVSGLSTFYSLVDSIWQPKVCAIPDAHLLGLTAGIRGDIRADCFRSCKLSCCRDDCVFLLNFNVQSDIFAVMIA